MPRTRGAIPPGHRSAPPVPAGDLADILDAAPAVQIATRVIHLERAGGGRWRGRCPVHAERTPSFEVTGADRPGRFQRVRCRGCGFAGNAVDLITALEGVPRDCLLAELPARLGLAPASQPKPHAPFAACPATLPGARATGPRERRRPAMDPHRELDLLRRVGCATVLERLPPPWKLDARESTRGHLKYRRGEGEILLVNHDGRGWWDPTSGAKGDVFGLVQHLRPDANFGEVRKILRPLAGVPQPTAAERVATARGLPAEALDPARGRDGPAPPPAERWARKPAVARHKVLQPPPQGSATWRSAQTVNLTPPKRGSDRV